MSDDETKEKVPVTGGMRVKVYPVLLRAVEEGFGRGWRRAHKHVDNPEDHVIEDQVISAIMGEICEVFDFDDVE